MDGKGVFGGLGVIVLVVGVAAAAATGQSNTVGLGSETFVPGEVILRFKPGLGTRTRSATLHAENATLGEPLLLPGAALVELSAGKASPEPSASSSSVPRSCRLSRTSSTTRRRHRPIRSTDTSGG